MEIDELFGLPAHPLLVHAPVVLIPAALLVAVLALWPRIRRVSALLAAFLAVVGGVAAILAVGSGEKLEDRVAESDLVEEHAEHGEAVELPAIVFAVVAVGGAVVVELSRRRPGRAAAEEARADAQVGAEPLVSRGPGAAAASPARASSVPAWAVVTVLAVSAIAGAYTTYTVVQAGHSGSKAVWDGQTIDGSGGADADDNGSGQGRGDDPDREESEGGEDY